MFYQRVNKTSSADLAMDFYQMQVEPRYSIIHSCDCLGLEVSLEVILSTGSQDAASPTPVHILKPRTCLIKHMCISSAFYDFPHYVLPYFWVIIFSTPRSIVSTFSC